MATVPPQVGHLSQLSFHFAFVSPCAPHNPHHAHPFEGVVGVSSFQVLGPGTRQGTDSALVVGALPNPEEIAWS